MQGSIEEDIVFHFESKLPISISVIFNRDLPSESFEIPIEYEQFEGTGSYISKLEFSKSVLNFIYGERSSIELKNQNDQAIEVNLTIDYSITNFKSIHNILRRERLLNSDHSIRCTSRDFYSYCNCFLLDRYEMDLFFHFNGPKRLYSIFEISEYPNNTSRNSSEYKYRNHRNYSRGSRDSIVFV